MKSWQSFWLWRWEHDLSRKFVYAHFILCPWMVLCIPVISLLIHKKLQQIMKPLIHYIMKNAGLGKKVEVAEKQFFRMLNKTASTSKRPDVWNDRTWENLMKHVVYKRGLRSKLTRGLDNRGLLNVGNNTWASVIT